MFSGRAFDPTNDIPDLAGKVFLVTGGRWLDCETLLTTGNTGLGYETIKQLAAHAPAAIYMASRTRSKAEDAIAELKTLYPSANIIFLELDLTSFTSIVAAVTAFKSQTDRLDVLMNNAGIMATPPGETAEGYEIQFGTNHMGHALLTKLLMPVLLKTAEGSDVRVVNLSSEGHNLARDAPTLLAQDTLKRLSPWIRYGYSKLANIIFTRGLADRYPSIIAVAVHPGVIRTNLYIPSTQNNFLVRTGIGLCEWFMTSIATGTKNQLWAATAPKEQLTSGHYYKPVGVESKGSPCARNAQLPDQLWTYTEKELAAYEAS